MQFLIQYAMRLVGIPYLFGGSTPITGFDCSGLVGELMIAAGLLPYDFRSNAQGLYDHFSKNGTMGAYGAGSLVFYGVDVNHIDHVAFCLDPFLMIEAGGGHTDTTSTQIATAEHAFVKMRPIKYRKDLLCVVKPVYQSIGMF
jgi:cell wall-associated NlpC family hydrolase